MQLRVALLPIIACNLYPGLRFVPSVRPTGARGVR